jgi:hypothetical protein
VKKVKEILEQNFPLDKMDAIAVGKIDFSSKKFEVLEVSVSDHSLNFSGPNFYYDLASLTKPLTNSLGYFLKPELFDEKMLLALSHRAGLPAWGLLSVHTWKEQVLSYPISPSPTLYSDFSALRVLAEFDKKGESLKKICQSVWDKEVLNWLDLKPELPLLQYGFINGEPNLGHVHDPNAYVIGEFCSHAGLFGTIKGVCQTLLNYESKTMFLSLVTKDLGNHKNRFSYGWDRVENFENPLAGKGCGPHSFGHLGFTGTSIWIDPDKNIGHVILSNATKNYWFDKEALNFIRREVGAAIWS